VPLLADLAAMRGVARKMNVQPTNIEPLVRVDLVVDHSVQIDHYGDKKALDLNMKLEFEPNNERYQFMKWGMQAFDPFALFPPAREGQVGELDHVRDDVARPKREKAREHLRGRDVACGRDVLGREPPGVGEALEHSAAREVDGSRQVDEARDAVAPAVKYHAGLPPADEAEWVRLRRAPVRLAQALANPNEARALLAEAAQLLDGMTPELRKTASAVQLRSEIALEQAARR